MHKVSSAALLLLTACSPSLNIPQAASVSDHASRTTGTQANLFIEDHSKVLEYTRDGRLVRTMALSARGTDSGSLAFDQSGNLYAIAGYFEITVFAPTSRKLVRTITNGVFEPIALAVDASGNLYVANESNGYNGNIAIYAPGSSTPSRTITQDIYDPESLAFDAAGNLYVGNGSYADAIHVYSPKGDLLRTITAGVQDPASIAVDARGDLFVANTDLGAGRTVTVYAPGKTKLLQTITDGIDSPQSLGVDSAGRLYVANNGNGTATIYAAKTRTLVSTISKGVRYPWVLTVDSASTLYLASLLPKAKVAAYPDGHQSPTHTIRSDGQWTALALAIGPP